MNTIDTFIEAGQKKAFAVAIDWPGWSRSGRDEAGALQALLNCAPRYAGALQGSGLEFPLPGDVAAFSVSERQPGNATTDFGSPGKIPQADHAPLDAAAAERSRLILLACWRAFDGSVERAAGHTLRSGPRGGGRDREKIITHVLDAEAAYIGRLGWKLDIPAGAGPDAALDLTRQAILAALEAAVLGKLPESGPRGGVYWPVRYFVRRSAWHVLDHAWEIDERVE